jgi:glycosyltransferase involved in cell wall biosynthesis
VKHVLFAHRKLSFGGGERVMVEQVAALADLPVQVSVLYRKDGPRRDLEPELRERNPNVREVLHQPGTLGSLAWLRRHRPDLIVLCNHKGMQRALRLEALLGRRTPTVLTLHEHYERHLRKYQGIKGLVDRWIITWAFEEAVRAHLGDQPCHLIHPLYPRDRAQPVTPEARRAARRELGLPEDGLLVGYVGQIDGRKEPLGALRFAEALPAGTRLLFAGREEESVALELEQAIAASPMADRVTRLGRVADTGPAFAALDLYVMTSRNEGFFPLALIEALERGVPVAAPPVGGIGTVLKDGQGGFLIPKADDRRSVPAEALAATARRLAPLMADPVLWEEQRAQAVALAHALTEGYDAATRFREAVAPWL